MYRQYRQRTKPGFTFDNNYRPQLQTRLGATPTFSEILQYHVQQYREIGTTADFHALQNGTAVLTTNEQCRAYLAAYGDMHRLKLDSAFAALFANVGRIVAQLEVVDWGCGQGMASGVLLDYLVRHQLPYAPARFTLIEPSELALSRATDHIQLLTDVPVRRVALKADEIATSLLTTDPDKVKIHLFSNLLDMPEVDYTAIARTIQASQSGENWFVCVSPAIIEARNRRLRDFRNLFAGAITVSERTDCFTGNVFRVYEKAYSAYSIKRTECLFTVQL